jgi:rubrerythrin
MIDFLGSLEIKSNSGYKNNHKTQNDFLICESCFWYASSLSIPADHYLIKNEKISKCPLCYRDRIRVIPIFLKGLQV